MHGDGYVAGDELDRACLGRYAASRVAAALCLGLADEFLRGVLVADIGRWTGGAHGFASIKDLSVGKSAGGGGAVKSFQKTACHLLIYCS